MNKLFKLLCSLPVILIALYYIPFLGIVLMLFRYYVYNNNKYYSMPIYLIISAIVIILPKLINAAIKALKISLSLDLDKIVESDIYINLLNYSKRLITVGVIFLILSFIFRKLILKLASKLKNGAKDYINKYEKEQREIREKNDLIVKERREIANNTHLVHCSNCGADNTIVGKTGKCKYCRSEISFKG